jgi:hypothetical protein
VEKSEAALLAPKVKLAVAMDEASSLKAELGVVINAPIPNEPPPLSKELALDREHQRSCFGKVCNFRQTGQKTELAIFIFLDCGSVVFVDGYNAGANCVDTKWAEKIKMVVATRGSASCWSRDLIHRFEQVFRFLGCIFFVGWPPTSMYMLMQ